MKIFIYFPPIFFSASTLYFTRDKMQKEVNELH